MKQNKLFFIIGITFAIAGCAFINIGPPWFQKYATGIPAGNRFGTNSTNKQWLDLDIGLSDDIMTMGTFDISEDAINKGRIHLVAKSANGEYIKMQKHIGSKWVANGDISIANINDIAVINVGDINYVVSETNDNYSGGIYTWRSSDTSISFYYSSAGSSYSYNGLDIDSRDSGYIAVYSYNDGSTNYLDYILNNNMTNIYSNISYISYFSPCIAGSGNYIIVGYITNNGIVIDQLNPGDNLYSDTAANATAMDITANESHKYLVYKKTDSKIYGGWTDGDMTEIDSLVASMNVEMEYWSKENGDDVYVAYTVSNSTGNCCAKVKRAKVNSDSTITSWETVGNVNMNASAYTKIKMHLIADGNGDCDVYLTFFESSSGPLKVWRYGADTSGSSTSQTDTNATGAKWANISAGLSIPSSIFDISEDAGNAGLPYLAAMDIGGTFISLLEYPGSVWSSNGSIAATNTTDIAMVKANNTNFVVFVTNDIDVLSWNSANSSIESVISSSMSPIIFDLDVSDNSPIVAVNYFSATWFLGYHPYVNGPGWGGGYDGGSPQLDDICIDDPGNGYGARIGFITNGGITIVEEKGTFSNIYTNTNAFANTMDIVANGNYTYLAYATGISIDVGYIDAGVWDGKPIEASTGGLDTVVMEHWDRGAAGGYVYVGYIRDESGNYYAKIQRATINPDGVMNNESWKTLDPATPMSAMATGSKIKMVVIPSGSTYCDVYIAFPDNNNDLQVWHYRDDGS